MTAISSIIDKKNKKTYIASDKMGSNGFTGEAFRTKKIFKNKHLTIAICGSYRLGQVLQHNLKPRAFQIGETVDEYIFDYLDAEIRKVFTERKCLTIKDGVEQLGNSAFIIAIKDRVFVLQNDLALLESEKIYATDGSGIFHQEASIHTQLAMNPKKDYKQILKDAIEYTSQIVVSVGGGVDIIEHNH